MTDSEIQWEGHKILLNSSLVPKYLWLATENIVKVDGTEVGRAGGFRLTDKLRGTFLHNNHPSELYLESKTDLNSVIDGPYKLYIDGNLISEGKLTINNNWLLPLTLERPNKKGKYRISNASCSLIIGILVLMSSIIFCISSIVIQRSTPGGYSNAPEAVTFLPGLCLLETGILSFFGIVAGILGFFEKARNKFHARVGFILSAVIFAGWVLLIINFVVR